MQSVAEPWLVLSISGSSFLLGLDAFATNAPFWMLALVGGVLADRKDRSLIIFLFQGVQMLCPLTIVLLIAIGAIKVWMIIAISLVFGITDALSMPAFSSLIPSMVSKRDLKPALALNSIQFNLSRVIGPAVAGLVMVRFGPLWCFGANALSYIPFFVSIHSLHTLKSPSPASSEVPDEDSSVGSIAAIVRNPRSGPVLLSVIVTAFFCSPILTFSPVFVQNVLHGDVGQFGGALTAFGIGGLLGPLLILATMKHVDSLTMALAAAAAFAICMIAASCIGTIWQLAAVLVGSGFLLTVANTSANTFLQSEANNRNRGQTASLYMLAMRGGMSLGNLATGTIVGLSNVQAAFLINGILAFAFQLFLFLRMIGSTRASR